MKITIRAIKAQALSFEVSEETTVQFLIITDYNTHLDPGDQAENIRYKRIWNPGPKINLQGKEAGR